MRGAQLREGDILARRYILLKPVGEGGMSVVWRAWDSTLERTVAVKVLDGPIASDGGQRDRIRREARAAARIEHPNAIGVYDYGETVTPRGRIAAYVVMQLLDGASLAVRLDEGPLQWPEAIQVAATVADVLQAAHRRGVVHRDVTPENVMLTTDGIRLLDFGIAADIGQREEAMTFGTPPYVAPERLTGAPASGATDVYSLGVLLYEMLTGAPPYPATTWEELERALAAERRPTLNVPGLPAAVAAVCLRCLSTDPQRRPSAAEVAEILEPGPGPARGLTWRRALLAAPVVVIAVGVLVLLLLQGNDPDTRQDNAAPSVAVSILVSTVPAPPNGQPTTTGNAQSKPPPRPTSAAATSPAALPLPLTRQAAGKAVLDVVDRRSQSGEIRSDVAQDIRNQINNILSSPSDAAGRIARLRQQLSDRTQDNSIKPDAYTELDAAVEQLSRTFATPSP
ncbi:serine/threonine protein kinase [Dactylosporangium vinaceum]|uniref:non-specific serine/threonine protein kinase n=1 Tax=Dactylosporangium vinaceum TaxID=53362 RepID=A0ABV5MMX4_9ACTN|nr:serine/threonine-protein kinase [Dactylosporangium vinaceum]UAB98637.1 serine/threonine protein kinase [Dactylosporangium vinaceum]